MAHRIYALYAPIANLLNQLSSHLKINNALDDVVRNTQDIIKRLEGLNIAVERTDTEKVLSQLNRPSIDRPETPPTPPTGVPVPEVNALNEMDAANRLLASADRYLDSERAYFAGEKDRKGTRSKPQSYRSATVESDDDDDMREESDQDDDMYLNDPTEEAPKPKNNAKRSRSGLSANINEPAGGAGVSMTATLPGLNASMNAQMPMNAGQGHQGYVPSPVLFQNHPHQHSPSPPPQYSQSGMNTQPAPTQSHQSPQSHPSTPLQQSYIPTSPYQQYSQQFPNQAYSPPGSPPSVGPQHPYFAGFPPTHPMTGFPIYGYGIPNQPMPMGGYGPGAVITNNNSGNVSNMNISNANNDNSVTTYNSNVLRSGLHVIFTDSSARRVQACQTQVVCVSNCSGWFTRSMFGCIRPLLAGSVPTVSTVNCMYI